MSGRPISNSDAIWLGVRRFISIGVAVSYAIAAVIVINLGIVPPRYLVLGLLLSGVIIVALIVWGLRKTSGVGNSIVFVLVGAMVISANIFVTSLGRTTTSFLGELQPPSAAQIQYSILAQRVGGTSLEAATSIGFLATDPLYESAAAAAAKLTPAAPQGHDGLPSILDEISSGALDLGAVQSSSLELFKDADRELYDSLEVIETFTIPQSGSPARQVSGSKPFIVYISGIDTYGDIGSASRSDVNMLAVINPDQHRILLVNTPRDYYVQLHGTTGERDKLTHAGIYGIDMSRQTMEDLYGVKIDGYVRINFTSLVKLVDAVGGVEVYSDYAFESFQKGKNTLNGERALEFSRERYSFADGDRQRGRNQQRVIEAIIAKVSDPRVLVNYRPILDSFGAATQTDISSESLVAMANQQLATREKWEVESISVDGSGARMPTYSMGQRSLYVMIPDDQSVHDAQSTIQSYLGS